MFSLQRYEPLPASIVSDYIEPNVEETLRDSPDIQKTNCTKQAPRERYDDMVVCRSLMLTAALTRGIY
jgi:hypothetical protein